MQFESCVRVTWLCHKNSTEYFTRFVADGLKTELELKSKIKVNVSSRDGRRTLEIEKRMLASIERHLASSGLTDIQIAEAKKLPDIAAMIDGLGQGRLTYIVGQKIGSHHVHGTWTSLHMHYLEKNEEGTLRPRGHDCETHIDQYVFIPLVLLSALKAHINFIFASRDDIEPMESLFDSIVTEIMTLNRKLLAMISLSRNRCSPHSG